MCFGMCACVLTMSCVFCACHIVASCMQLRTSNMLKTDDTVTRFFRISTELCVELCYRNLQGDIGVGSLCCGGTHFSMSMSAV